MLLLVAGYSFSSYSTGPSGTVLTCSRSSCHSFVTDKTYLNYSIKEKWSGLMVKDSFYKANTDYVIELTGINKDSLEHFGFQSIATSSTGSGSGTLVALSASTSSTAISGNPTIAHNSIIEGIKKGHFEISFEWRSPNSGSGDIAFSSILNAVNFNGSSSGDQPSEIASIFLKEKSELNIQENKNFNGFKVLPNPCTNLLHFETTYSNKFMVTVFSFDGHELIPPSHQNNIDVSALAAGVYLLRLNTENGQQTATFVKQ